MRTYKALTIGLALLSLISFGACKKRSSVETTATPQTVEEVVSDSKPKPISPTPEVTVPVYANHNFAIGAGDLDGDGKAEIVTAGTRINNNEVIEVYVKARNNLKKVADLSLYGGTSYYGLDLVVEDMDSDKMADIVVAGTTITDETHAEPYLIKSPKAYPFAVPKLIGTVPVYAKQLSVTVTDINSDGYKDIVVGGVKKGENEKGEVYILYGQANGTYKFKTQLEADDPVATTTSAPKGYVKEQVETLD